MQRQRWAWTHRYAVPMFVASLIAVILSGSGLVAVMVFANGGDDSPGNTNGNPDTVTDPCVVGTWRVVSYTENSSLGTAELVEGTPVFTFEQNGTGVAVFRDVGIEAQLVLGARLEAGVDGQIVYEWQTSGDTLEFVDQESTAEFSSDMNVFGYEDQLTMPTGPLRYTCGNDAMAITGDEQALEYERSG